MKVIYWRHRNPGKLCKKNIISMIDLNYSDLRNSEFIASKCSHLKRESKQVSGVLLDNLFGRAFLKLALKFLLLTN